jgi:antirestriction protein ArdC
MRLFARPRYWRGSGVKRDLYAEVSTRIVAELERGAAPWIKPWSATAGQNVPQNAVTNRPYSGCNVILLWLARNRGWATPRFLTFKQAIEVGGNVRKGEHGTKVYFVKQLQIKDSDSEEADTRLIPMMREYTVFSVDQWTVSISFIAAYRSDYGATGSRCPVAKSRALNAQDFHRPKPKS